MPKKTFFNLPFNKQTKILKSSIKEFSKCSLADASIANIISDAGIPRGSFYQYFENKEDLYFYVLHFHTKDIKNHLITCLLKNKGDIIESFLESFKYVLDKITEQDKASYFKNIFLNMNYEIERMFTPNLEDNLNDVINLIDLDKLVIDNKLQLIYIIDVIEAVMIRNIVQSYKRNMSKEKNIEVYTKEINLIRTGIYK
ncbi:MAG: TetR/AcrR family transcriptional regulator [Bacilli bacterium]|nr:TetR/AcrR family transcriptional regulator [Bacilli bacterium]